MATLRSGKVIGSMVMSLDGYISDEEGRPAPLYADLTGLVATPELHELIQSTGAVVMGRRSYDMPPGDFTGYAYQTPIFVATHHIPAQVARGENERLRFHFVTEGVASAITQAKIAAGNQNVVIVGGASTMQQALQARLLDELHLYLMPIMLNGGTRLLENFDRRPMTLEAARLIEWPRVVYMRYRIPSTQEH